MGHIALFDIDGTLVGGAKRHKRSFNHAFRKVYGIDADISTIDFQGKSDRGIIFETLSKAGLREEDITAGLEACMGVMVEFYTAEEDSLFVFPGVEGFLESLTACGYTCGLITGNVEAIGWHKLKALGLDGYFAFGGFGSEALDRADVLRRALEKGGISSEDAGNVLVFGDTPKDIEAARNVGCRIICVGTGPYTVEELADADVVISSFEGVEALQNFLGKCQ